MSLEQPAAAGESCKAGFFLAVKNRRIFMLTYGIDWDDVISDLNTHAITLANKEHALNLKLEDINSWENVGKASIIKQYYQDERIYRMQTVTDEAKNFIHELQKKGKVYIITAIAPQFMSLRAEQILTAFPDFPEQNIIMGFQKSLVRFDVTLDDGPHNILKSCAKYPVLMRRPWNDSLSGILSVNHYGEFLQLIDQIKESMLLDKKPVSFPSVIALVGPSGSGKNELAKRLEKAGAGKIVHSYTTGTADGFHQRLSAEEFKNKKNDFVTVTVYAGNKYGILASDIAKMIEDGINPIVPLDIGGAIAMKRLFSTAILFCRSSREKMISNILEKTISNQEKMYRLLSLENEIDNEELCDFSIRTDNMEEAIEQVRMLLSIEKIDRK
jgi:guanylate kinase